MDPCWGLLVRNTTATTLCALISNSKSTSYCSPGKLIVSSRRSRNPRCYGVPPFVVRAAAEKGITGGNDDDDDDDGVSSSPGGDASKGSSSSDGRKSNDAPLKFHHVNPDWREFRAKMIEVEKAEANAHIEGEQAPEITPIGRKWAHPLSAPENGCILVATEKLDGMRTFERTVVLLLNIGTGHPQGGPFGVVINRPTHKKVRQMRPNKNSELAKTFADYPLHFGGPLDASMLLIRAGETMKHPEFEEVIPGLFFGSRNSVDEAAALVKNGVLKPDDFRLFFGYSGWQLDQLREEIESEYWHVAACSLDLIHGDSSSENLWQEVLQLMGGHYSELSRKPKNDM